MSMIGVPGPDFFAFLNLRLRVALPDLLEHDESGERRFHRHQLRVALGVLQGALGALALDFEDPRLRHRRPPLQLERLLQLRQARGRLLDGQRVLLGLDARHDFVLARLDRRALDVALGLGQFGFVARPRNGVLRSLFLNLAVEVDQLGPALGRGANLLLAVELDDQIAGLDAGARLDQVA